MNNPIVINHRQMVFFVSAILTGGGLVSFQQEMIRIAKMDAWFTYFIAMLYAFLICWFLYFLHKSFPGKTIFEINKVVAGPFFGGLISLAMVLHIWSMIVRDLNAIGQFIKSILLPNTPLEITMLLLILLLIQFGRTSIEVVARVNDMFYPIYMLVIFSLPLLLANEFNPALLQPFLTRRPDAFVSSGALEAGWFGDLYVLGAFLTTMGNSKQLFAAAKHGVVLGTVILSVYVLSEISVLSAGVAGNLIYPSYTLVQQTHISDFLDRVDLVMLSLWFPTMVVKMTVLYSAFLIGISSFFRKRAMPIGFNMPCGLFVLLTSIYSFHNSTETFLFGNFVSPVLTFGLQIPVFALLVVLSWNKKQPPPPANPAESGRKGQNMRLGILQKLVRKYPLSRWRWITRCTIAAAGCSLLVGLTYSRYIAAVGIICMIVYCVSMLLMLLSSYMEVQRTL